MKMNGVVRGLVAAALVPMMLVQQSFAWGAVGHRMINKLATQALPADVPEFLRTPAAVDAMEYYGPEPDHWQGQGLQELGQAGLPEHYIDLEWADLIGGPLPRRRYDFIRALAVAQKAHLDLPLTPEKVGMQPWAATEQYERLMSAMHDYRLLARDHKDTRAVEAEIIFVAGVMGHFVADGSQPLHTTIQYNGWTGENPNNYTTLHKIHSQFESDFVKAHVDAKKDVVPLIPVKAEVVTGDVFDQYVGYLRKTHEQVEKTYELEKAGGFSGEGSAEAKAFTDERLAAGATELRNLIYTAWVKSADIPEYREPKPAVVK